jgi:hypothetical protein
LSFDNQRNAGAVDGMSIALEVGVPARTTSAVALIGCLTACGGRTVVVTPPVPVSPSQLAELRVDPGEERDLFWGFGGRWRDAFRAGNYAVPQAERNIRRIKEKIADGLVLRVDRRGTT